MSTLNGKLKVKQNGQYVVIHPETESSLITDFASAVRNTIPITTRANNAAYKVGDCVFVKGLPSWAYLECTQAGTTAATAPSTITTTVRLDTAITDGTAKWIVRQYGVPSNLALRSIAKNNIAADSLLYGTGANTFSTTSLSSLGRTLIGKTTAADMRSVLGARENKQLTTADIQNFDSAVSNKIPVTSSLGRTLIGKTTAADMRSVLGARENKQLTTADIQNFDSAVSNKIPVTTRANNTAYKVGDCVFVKGLPSWAYLECTQAGTTAATAPSTITTTVRLDTAITDGTAKWIVRQYGLPSNPALRSIIKNNIVADSLLYGTGANTFAITALSSLARTLLSKTTAADMRSVLGAIDSSQVPSGDSPSFANDVISSIGKQSLSALGVRYSMTENGYICFGQLFGGLILQWMDAKKYFYDVDENNALNVILPITCSRYVAELTDGNSKCITYGINIISGSKFRVYSRDDKYNTENSVGWRGHVITIGF